jgi:alpha-aminoadipic semialdehyde synthase
VTASYVSQAMQALDEKAKEAGVTLLCEMGLDPGIGMFSTLIPMQFSVSYFYQNSS